MTKSNVSHTKDLESETKLPEPDAQVRAFLRCLRAGDIIGRYGDMETDKVWGGNRTTLAIVGTLINYPEGMRQKDIAKAVFRTKQATTIALDSLEEEGFIERGTDPQDRRINTIRLTEKGSARFYEMQPALTGVCHEAMSVLDEAEVEQLNNLLTKFTGILRKRIDEATSKAD